MVKIFLSKWHPQTNYLVFSSSSKLELKSKKKKKGYVSKHGIDFPIYFHIELEPK